MGKVGKPSRVYQELPVICRYAIVVFSEGCETADKDPDTSDNLNIAHIDNALFATSDCRCRGDGGSLPYRTSPLSSA